jgi:RNA polymerase sigma-70 factor (ECF subfamily)
MQAAYALSPTVSFRAPVAPETTSDEALIRAIGEGDKRAMHDLFTRHNVRVYRFVLRLTGRPSLAEDLVNEVFLEVWRHADRFEARSQVSTWLLAIARFKAISAMRQRQHEELDEDVMMQVEDPADDPEESVMKSDRSALVRKCLTQLSPTHREIIDLVYYHEKSVAEAGEIIGIPQATVKTRMFYARKQLAELLRNSQAEYLLS